MKAFRKGCHLTAPIQYYIDLFKSYTMQGILDELDELDELDVIDVIECF